MNFDPDGFVLANRPPVRLSLGHRVASRAAKLQNEANVAREVADPRPSSPAPQTGTGPTGEPGGAFTCLT